jgi:hypothetical protein
MSNRKYSISVPEMEFIASIRGKSISDFKPRIFNKTYRIRMSEHEYKRLEQFRQNSQHITDLQASNEKVPRILIFDIETAPMKAYVWGKWKQDIASSQFISDWYVLSWSAKWLNNNNIMSDVLSPQEALNENDERVVKSLWHLFDQSDIIIAHNACVEKNTPILMQDLTWKKAGDLVVGDKIVGFEEKTKPGNTRRDKDGKWMGRGERKVLSSEVKNIEIESRKCMEVEFDNGDKIITTPDHYWLGMSENSRNQQWYRTDKLRIGQRVNKFIYRWETDNSYEAGWLSGFISGEGTLKGNGHSIDFCQRPTIVLDQALQFCDKLNIRITEPKVKIGGIGRGDTLYLNTLGGKWKTIEILGKLQIKRLIEKINWDKFGGLNSTAKNNTTRTIVNIKEVGNHEVAVIETSTGTYIADGYPMHNCKFDVPKMNARFIVNGLNPPSPYRIIDTLLVARKNFAFTSNKLDDLAEYFNIDHKKETSFALWDKCVNGDQDALNYMEEYNVKDVDILEKVYLRLRPWIKNHPNLSLYLENEEETCPYCGSTNLADTGTFTYTNVSKFSNVRCLDCHAVSRRRTSDYPKDKRKSLITSV